MPGQVPIWRQALTQFVGHDTKPDGLTHLDGRTHANSTASDAAVYAVDAAHADLLDAQTDLRDTLVDLNTQVTEHTLRTMLTDLGQGHRAVSLTNEDVLTKIRQRAEQSAKSITQTYVADMLKFGKAADQAGVSGADFAKLLTQWDADRAAWKDAQIAKTETATARGLAKREFVARSGVRGHATFGNSLQCALCQSIADDNPYELDDDTVGTVPHPGCLDDWNIHVDGMNAVWTGGDEPEPLEPPAAPQPSPKRTRTPKPAPPTPTGPEMRAKVIQSMASHEAKIDAMGAQITDQFTRVTDLDRAAVGMPNETAEDKAARQVAMDAADKEGAKLQKLMAARDKEAREGRALEQTRKMLNHKDKADISVHFDSTFSAKEKKALAKPVETWRSLVGRGTVMDGEQINFTRSSSGERSFYTHTYRQITVEDGTMKRVLDGQANGDDTVIHEMTHWFEGVNNRAAMLTTDHLEDRTAGLKPEPLNDIYDRKFDYPKYHSGAHYTGYRPDEEAVEDAFDTPYMGKVYKWKRVPGKFSSVPDWDTDQHEMLTMAIQNMWRDPAGFARRDPDSFDLIWHVLHPELDDQAVKDAL